MRSDKWHAVGCCSTTYIWDVVLKSVTVWKLQFFCGSLALWLVYNYILTSSLNILKCAIEEDSHFWSEMSSMLLHVLSPIFLNRFWSSFLLYSAEKSCECNRDLHCSNIIPLLTQPKVWRAALFNGRANIIYRNISFSFFRLWTRDFQTGVNCSLCMMLG